ncbi:DNA ligase 1 isoform X2 [Centruroides vittatus]|uniref:DNA ligase 1 isoform X2 n=1 Tax=Centruroides vittatus TaxID=120091 RepID=UPI00350ECF92
MQKSILTYFKNKEPVIKNKLENKINSKESSSTETKEEKANTEITSEENESKTEVKQEVIDDSPIKCNKVRRKRIESDEEEESPKDKVQEHKVKEENVHSNGITNNNFDQCLSIPRRKTARKQMKRTVIRNGNDFANIAKKQKMSEEVAVKIELNEIEKEEKHMNEVSSESKSMEKNEEKQSSGKESSPKSFNSEKDDVAIEYNPTKANYHIIEDAIWKRGEKVPYLALARTLEEIENISSRLKMIEILSNFFRSVIVLTPEDLLYSVYLCLNKVAPDFEGIELGIGDMVLMKAISQATGRTVDKIKADITVRGDLGLVAENCRGTQKIMFAPPKLTIPGVYNKLKDIAKMTGNASMNKKIEKIKGLFVACRHCEARYLIRSLSGKLRVGLAEQSILSALAQAAVLTPPNQEYPPKILNSLKGLSSESIKKKFEENVAILKSTYCECPSYDLIIPVLLSEGLEALPDHCHITPGIPLKPMLAHPTKGIEEILQRFEKSKFTCEFKYDGERAQIHVLEDGRVQIYSRNQENNTSKYPDIISRMPLVLKPEIKSCIIDSEAVAWDVENKQILPFQVLSTRKRKDVVESEIKIQVCIFAFDLLYLNGKSLVKMNLRERRELLHQSFEEIESKFMFALASDISSTEDIQEFLDKSVKQSCEGLMVKTLDVDASYEIAKRSHNWLKLKKDYLDGVGDTLDVVVIGGYRGKGKRTGTYGGFLLACYDVENEEFQTVCKIGTGFTEEELELHNSFFKEHVIPNPKSYYRYDSSVEPDEWFEPVQVWEIKCADLSKSPVHKAAVGILDPEKGISLRFPRFLRIREDKTPEEATSANQIVELYKNQEQVKNQKSHSTNADDNEFY